MASPTEAATSRQVVFTGVDSIEVAETPIPQVGPDEILMRIVREGICATDLHLLAGHIGDPFPVVPGHEFVGEVAAIGPGATEARNLQIGDRITVEMLLPCRQCPRCREGRYNLCDQDDMLQGLDRGRQYGVNIPRTVDPGLWGGYAQHLIVPEAAIVHRLPESLPWDVAALVEPLAVAQRTIVRGRVAPGENVVVIGPGPVGILAVAAARAAGAGTVIMAGTRESRLETATRFGADAVINIRTDDAGEQMRHVLGGRADVVIEAAGVAAAQEQAVQLARRGGRVVLAGACGAGVPVTFHQDEDVLLKELDVVGSFLSAGGYEPAISMLTRAEFPFAELVTHTFGLDDVHRAFQVVRDRDQGVLKAVLDPTRRNRRS